MAKPSAGTKDQSRQSDFAECSFSLPRSLLTKLESIADASEREVGELVIEALRRYLTGGSQVVDQGIASETAESVPVASVVSPGSGLGAEALDQLTTMLEEAIGGADVDLKLDALLGRANINDPQLTRHSEEVAELAGRTAEAMDLGAEDVVAIRLAGLIHDLGKLSVRDPRQEGKADTGGVESGAPVSAPWRRAVEQSGSTAEGGPSGPAPSRALGR